MKKVNFPLETAKQFYNSGNPESKQFALDNYTKEELEQKKLPKTREELEIIDGYYIDQDSSIIDAVGASIYLEGNKNIFPTKELAEAALALAQLLQLRDRYNDGWVGDFTKDDYYYGISNYKGAVRKIEVLHISNSMTFKTAKLRDEFFGNFKDLLEIAKPLL